jgi:N-acetylglucosaminyldiphosphoundecaprenol N-acetyl-beta-D-mannosaminyltransferase
MTVMQEPPRIRLLGVELDRLDGVEALDTIADSLRKGHGGWVLTINLEILRRLVSDPELARLCEAADLRLADGMPLIWASRLQRTPLPERVSGSDLIWTLCERASREGWSVYLLGGNPGTAERASEMLARAFPGLRVVGHYCPPFGFQRDPAVLARIDRLLTAAHPDIVFVGLGSPKQDRLITRLRGVLPAAWFLGVGISFSFVTGEIRRAPPWMRRLGLEWLHRLAQEPRRLARRYLFYGVPFAIRLLMLAVWTGFGAEPP